MTVVETGGLTLPEAPPEFNKFTEVEVLAYYDGPLITHYRDPFQNDWIESWFGPESDSKSPWVWLLLRVPNIQDYLDGKIDYLTVFKTSPEMWLYKESDSSYKRILFDELDPEGLPQEGAFITYVGTDKEK